MIGTHDQLRALIDRTFADLARSDAAALRDISSADVCWWLPLGRPEHRGISDVADALINALAGKEAVTQSVILSADSRSAVVEQLLRDPKGTTTPATSVLTLLDGALTAGRTYLDVAAWPGENTDASSDTDTEARRG